MELEVAALRRRLFEGGADVRGSRVARRRWSSSWRGGRRCPPTWRRFAGRRRCSRRTTRCSTPRLRRSRKGRGRRLRRRRSRGPRRRLTLKPRRPRIAVAASTGRTRPRRRTRRRRRRPISRKGTRRGGRRSDEDDERTTETWGSSSDEEENDENDGTRAPPATANATPAGYHSPHYHWRVHSQVSSPDRVRVRAAAAAKKSIADGPDSELAAKLMRRLKRAGEENEAEP